MSDYDETLQAARRLAREISATAPESPIPLSEITRLRGQLAAPELLAQCQSALQQEALACLDQTPREAYGLAHVAHGLADSRQDPAYAETALTLAIVLNRIGEFRDARKLAGDAAAAFDERAETRQAARSYGEAAWANSFLGHLDTTLENVARARERDSSPLAQARCDWIQARVLRDQSDYTGAEELFVKSRTVFESAGMPLDAARCARELAHASSLGERKEVVPLLESARKTFAEAACVFDVAFCDLISGVALFQTASYVASEKFFTQARASFVQVGNAFFTAWSDAQLATVYMVQSHNEESLQASHRARDYFLAHAVPVEVSACDINLGLVYFARNQYDEALKYYEEAAENALKEGRVARAGRIFNNMGETYAKQGLYAQALDLHQRALEIYTDLGLSSLVGSALLNLAVDCRQLGQYESAIDYLQRARQIFVQRNIPIRLAECEFNLADVCFALSEINAANIQLQRAREIYAENKLDSLVAVCDRLLARLASEKGDRVRALALLADSRATFGKRHQIVDAALCDLAEGEIQLKWNERAAAQQALLRAQATLAPGFPDQAWRVESGLGHCAKMAGDPADALEHYLDAVRIIAQSRSILVTEQLSNDYFSSRRSVYDLALELAVELAAPASALEVVEAGKARIFSSLLQNRQWNVAHADANPATARLLTREKEMRFQLDALRAKAMVAPPDLREQAGRGDEQADAAHEALRELNVLSREYEAVVARLQLSSNGLAGVSAPAPFALERFRELTTARLGKHWAALDYYLSGDELTCIAVQPARLSVSTKKLGEYERVMLEKCVSPEHDLRELLYGGTLHGFPAPSPGADYLTRLDRLLMPEWLDHEILIIAPHGPLHALPFHALKHGSDFLVQHHTILYTPSLQALQLLLDEQAVERTESLAIGLSEFAGQMPGLPSADAEIEQFVSVFGEQVNVLQGERAARKQILSLNQSGSLQNYGMLHFATHAILDHNAPHRSRVLLHDEPLTILDIMELRLNARLVTLSACETALGQNGSGDELVGLARAFFYAGARALLASLWKVEDRSIADLIGRFYRHLAGGENNAVALRSAQVEMIEAGFSPFQWASLALMGRP